MAAASIGSGIGRQNWRGSIFATISRKSDQGEYANSCLKIRADSNGRGGMQDTIRTRLMRVRKDAATALNGKGFARTVSDLAHLLISDWRTRALVFAGLAAYLVTGVLFMNAPIEYTDYWQHLSSFKTLSQNIADPAPLYFNETYEVHLYTPFHVFWGGVLSLGVFDIWTVSKVAAFCNLIIFYVGCRLIAARFFNDHRYDMIVAMSLLFLWGQPLWMSGVYSFGQLILQSHYPSFFVFALSLCLIALFPVDRLPKPVEAALFVVGFATAFLSHPITASVLFIFIGLKALFYARKFNPAHIAAGGAMAFIGIAVALFLWPYYAPLAIILDSQDGDDFFGRLEWLYDAPHEKIGPAAAGFLAWAFALKTRHFRYFTIAGVLLISIYAANYYLNLSYVFSRYIIYLMLALQLGALMLAIHFRTDAKRSLVLPVFLLLLASSIPSQLFLSLYSQFGLYTDYKNNSAIGTAGPKSEYGPLAAYFSNQTEKPVVLAPDGMPIPVAAMSDVELVTIRTPVPTLSSYRERNSDALAFFDSHSSCAQRQAIVDKWRVSHVVLRNGDPLLPPLLTCNWRRVEIDRGYSVLETRS